MLNAFSYTNLGLIALVFTSCKEAYNYDASATTGIYDLTLGKHYCVMQNIPNCGQGGWTLAMKIDGSKVR